MSDLSILELGQTLVAGCLCLPWVAGELTHRRNVLDLIRLHVWMHGKVLRHSPKEDLAIV